MEKFYRVTLAIEEILTKHCLELRLTQTKGAFIMDQQEKYRLKMEYLNEKLKTTDPAKSVFLQAMLEINQVLNQNQMRFRDLLKTGLYLEDKNGKGKKYEEMVQAIRQHEGMPPLQDILTFEEKLQKVREYWEQKMFLTEEFSLTEEQLRDGVIGTFYNKFESEMKNRNALDGFSITPEQLNTQQKYEEIIQFLVERIGLQVNKKKEMDFVYEILVDAVFRWSIEEERETEQKIKFPSR